MGYCHTVADAGGTEADVRQRRRQGARLRPLVAEMDKLERELAALLQQRQEPDEAFRERYEKSFGELQGHAGYQAMVAAQANFDRILAQVNEAIGKGMEQGSGSRIIIPRS